MIDHLPTTKDFLILFRRHASLLRHYHENALL